MRVLVVGGGGREHSLCSRLGRSAMVEDLHCAPGNAGIAQVATVHAVGAEDISSQVDLARSLKSDLVVVGPEAPLVAGIGDALRAEQIRVFGPNRVGARLEGSKSYAKELMRSSGIPTARAKVFEDPAGARSYLDEHGAPVVVKADGLAAGKGVVVCASLDEARRAVAEAMEEARFGDAGRRVVIEEFMEGPELSVLALSDGRTLLPLEAAQDFKRIGDGDVGPNTGGMGAYSPVPLCDDQMMGQIVDTVLEPIAQAIRRDSEPYVGVIYAGLMITDAGPKVVEFNCRFGDPEVQAVLPRLTSDLAEALMAAVTGQLEDVKVSSTQDVCVTVVAASHGYPGAYETGKVITGLEDAASIDGVEVFHAGTARNNGEIVTDGGRVLSVSALGEQFAQARQRAYEALSKIGFEGKYHRTDIAEQPSGG